MTLFNDRTPTNSNRFVSQLGEGLILTESKITLVHRGFSLESVVICNFSLLDLLIGKLVNWLICNLTIYNIKIRISNLEIRNNFELRN